MAVKSRVHYLLAGCIVLIAMVFAIAGRDLAAIDSSSQEVHRDVAMPGVVIEFDGSIARTHEMGSDIRVMYRWEINDPSFGGKMSLRGTVGRYTVRRTTDKALIASNEFVTGMPPTKMGPIAGEHWNVLQTRLEPGEYDVVASAYGVAENSREFFLNSDRRVFTVECNRDAKLSVGELNSQIESLEEGPADAAIRSVLRQIVVTDDVVKSIHWPKVVRTIDLANAANLSGSAIERIVDATDATVVRLEGTSLSGADLLPLTRMKSLKVVTAARIKVVTEDDAKAVQALVENGVEVRR